MKNKKRRKWMVTAMLILGISILSGCSELEELLADETQKVLSEQTEAAPTKPAPTEADAGEREDNKEESYKPSALSEEVQRQMDNYFLDPEDSTKKTIAGHDEIGIALSWWKEESGSANLNFNGDMADDFDNTTAWITKEGQSEGAWLKYYFGFPVTIRSVAISNGDIPDFAGFERIKEAELVFDDGSTVRLLCEEEAKDVWIQEITPVTTSSVLFQIKSVFPGKQYANVVLRELAFITNPDAPKFNLFYKMLTDNEKEAGDQSAGD